MSDFIVGKNLEAKTVNGINSDGSKESIGKITPVDNFIFWYSELSKIQWQFESTIDDVAFTGTWAEVEQFINEWMGLDQGVAA